MSVQLTTTTQLTKFTIKEFAGFQIKQREDGYLNATEMCKVGKKDWSHYKENKQTNEYLTALESALGIPRAQLVHSITANCPDRGTWIHPRVAIHLAQWVSPQFAVQVTDWVLRFMSGDLTLVAEVVQRHDEVNNTESKVIINTISKELIESRNQNREYINQLQSFKSLASQLELQIKKLTDETKKINTLKCPYCFKLYSSPIGLTTHIRKNCDDNKRRQFRAIIDFDRFKEWSKLVVDDWKEISEENDFDFNLVVQNWNTNQPKIKPVYQNKKNKNILFNISLNDSRWQFLELINKKISVPLGLLMEKNSLKMYNENNNTFEIYTDSFMQNAELLKYQELYDLIHNDE